MSGKEKIIFEKDGFKFSKISSTHYCSTFYIKNQYILLPSIINFDLIKLIYDLNPDIYQYVNLNKINDSETICIFIIKHFFEDLGLPQRYAHLNMKKSFDDNSIIFHAESIRSDRPDNIPEHCEPIAINNMISTCEIITQHSIKFTHNIYFGEGINIPPFVEKIIGTIVNKIFKRVKQFIENIRV